MNHITNSRKTFTKTKDFQYYKGTIWTNHALERLEERGFTQEMAYQAFNKPDKAIPGKESGTTEFRKRFENSIVTVIATKNEHNEWIVISCWIDPPLEGTKDAAKKEAYEKYHKASTLGKLWIIFLRQIGLAKY